MEAIKILLVDDDTLCLATFAQGLKKAGYEVLSSDNGIDGLKMAAQEPSIDLAILDMRMPGLSGVETARGLRELGVPSLFLSAYAVESEVKLAIDEGALGYILKPAIADRIVPEIESVLKRSKDMDKLKGIGNRLNGALDTGNQVNVAIGVIMEHKKLGRQETFELIRKKARAEQRKVKDIAKDILDAWETVNSI